MAYFKKIKSTLLFILFVFCFLPHQNSYATYSWQFGFQDPASPVMEMVQDFHNLLLHITIGIVILVFGLLGYVCLRFNAKANPVPSTTSHNVVIEIIWTVVPVIILALIAIPSFKTLYFMENRDDYDMTIKVVGHQWYWEYQYPDHGAFSFDSYMIQDSDLKPGQLRLLEVDNRVVVPVNTNIKVLVTSFDVIHSWAIPSLGVKMDAVPGRMNETWFRVTKPGVYYGQCSELCGIGHGFMPIAIEAVDKTHFDQWAKEHGKTV